MGSPAKIAFLLAVSVPACQALAAVPSAEELGVKYGRTFAEADRVAWIEALNREGWDFSKRVRAKVDSRGIYKLNRDSKLLCMALRRDAADECKWEEAVPPDGTIKFEWKRKPNRGFDYSYSAPTNWDVFVTEYYGEVTRFGAKVLKSRLSVDDPAPSVSIPEGWRIVEGEAYSGRNVREAYFTFEKDGTNLPPPRVSIDWKGVGIASVHGAEDVEISGSKAVFTPVAPKPPLVFSTKLPGFGAVSATVVKHHFKGMQAGPYANYHFPSNEIRACANFMFALRDGFRRVGFDRKEAFDGRVYIGGFDSNFPNGHTDFPPHFHMSPHTKDGTQTHHFYLDAGSGRVTSDCYQDMNNVIDIWDNVTMFHPGDTFPAFGNDGRVWFRTTLIADGSGLDIAAEDGSWRFRVSGERPCDAVDVSLPSGDGWSVVKSVTVEDDPLAGVLETPEGIYRYDPATGRLLD